MTLIAKDHASEAGHWYTRDGEPMYTVMGKTTGKMRNTTLRDAREMNLVPSVTTILNVAAKPALTNWLQEQVLLAALTLPRAENESEAVYIKRIMEDSKTQGRDAADLGTDIHAAVQGFYEGRKESRFPFHVAACDKALQHTFGQVDWICERSFAHELGFGGKCDLYSAVGDGLVADIKTKDFDEESISKVKPYDEHMMQLAAYRVGLGVPDARCANIFLSRTNPELVIVHQWAEDDIQRGWAMFVALLNFWQLKNNHE